MNIDIFILLFVFFVVFLWVSFIFIRDKKDYLKNENILLKHNIDECYKYIEQLEKEKKEGHYD